MLALVLALVGQGPTDPASAQVQWDAPDGCPTEVDVRGRVDALLASSGSGRREPIALQMTVTATETGFALLVSSRGPDGPAGQRTVDGTRCEDLTNAAVLIAAIAIDPDLTPPPPVTDPTPEPEPEPLPEPEPEPEPEPLPEPEPEPAPEPEPDTARPPAPEPSPSRRPPTVQPLLTFDAGLGLGRLAAPRPMALARLAAGIERHRFRALARLSGFGPSLGDVEGFPGGGTFGAVTFGLLACGRTEGRWSFVGCGGTDVGAAFGRGRNTIHRSTSATAPWWALEAEAGVEYAWSNKWAVAGRLDGAISPVRTDFVVDGQGRACCVRWGAGVRVGVLRRFGPSP